MDPESLFSLAGLLAMSGWLLLMVSPLIPKWSDRIAGQIIPMLLSCGYLVLAILHSPSAEGGFGSLADVSVLFSTPAILLTGWVHFLAFDLFIGAWMCRVARREGVAFYYVLPCLPVTFLFGPAGYLLFSLLREFSTRQHGKHALPG